jgi:hypothetical protein
MSSLRKVLSSRANGALSPGPSTLEAKRISSQNALYRGLFARCVVLENESREAFDTLMGQHLDRLKPFDGVELGMVEEMVAAHWRLSAPSTTSSCSGRRTSETLMCKTTPVPFADTPVKPWSFPRR